MKYLKEHELSTKLKEHELITKLTHEYLMYLSVLKMLYVLGVKYNPDRNMSFNDYQEFKQKILRSSAS